MMGGGFFDNMWDPYSGAYAYPRTQPRARYYRPRAPVYGQRPAHEQHPAHEQRGSANPENRFPGKVKVEDSAGKTVRTIPVTDGSVAVEVKAEPVEVKPKPVEAKAQPVVRFESEDTAARKIQAVYRGYSVRRSEPLKHLRVIMKVREEFAGLKRRLEDREVRMRVGGDAQEKLRWTEGIMALLLRLDQLQGVHPEVRVLRKAAAKELLMFQEELDSMCDPLVEENVEGDVAAEKVEEDDSVAEVRSEMCDVAEEGAGSIADGDVNGHAAEAVEEMDVEEVNVDDVTVEDAAQFEAEEARVSDAPREEMEQDVAAREEGKDEMQAEAGSALANDAPQEEMLQDAAPLEEKNDGTQIEALASDAHRETMEQDAPPELLEINDREHTSDGVKVTEMSSSEHHVPQGEVMNSEDQSGSPSDRIGESMVGDAEQDGLRSGAPVEAPMDVEDEASTVAPARVETGPLQSAPPTDVDLEDVSGVEDTPPTDFEVASLSKEADLVDSTEKNENHKVGTERLVSEAERSELNSHGNGSLIQEERAPDAGATEPGDGWIVSASPTSMEPRQCSAKSLQVGEPQNSAPGDTNSLPDRALLKQLLEENRKLKDVVGKVLHWGKQQNDIIHSLASRIEHLEGQQPQANMLAGEQMNGRKRICNDGGWDWSQRSKGRRKGRRSNRHHIGYPVDSEWLSADSDEYF